MNIAHMNQRITFEKNAVNIDSIGNHKNSWQMYYECACTVGGENGKEEEAAGTTVEHTDISFTVRYCKYTEKVTEDGYRIIFNDGIYDIVSIDHMNYRKKSIKFRCRKVRR